MNNHIEQMLSNGWGGIDNPENLTPEQQAKANEEKKKQEAEDKKLNSAIFAAFSSGPGAVYLEWLKSRTIDQPCYVPTLGDQAYAHGLVREGQNSMYREIVRRMALAMEG